jgi:hypothetical protein
MTAPRSAGGRVADQGTVFSFAFRDLLRYAGPGSPVSLAMAYQAMRLSFPLLDAGNALVRREIGIETAYRGPRARDGFELVTQAVTDGRYLVTSTLERPERGVTLHTFVFRVAYHDQACALLVRPGLVDDAFMAMARTAERSEEDERRFTEMTSREPRRVGRPVGAPWRSPPRLPTPPPAWPSPALGPGTLRPAERGVQEDLRRPLSRRDGVSGVAAERSTIGPPRSRNRRLGCAAKPRARRRRLATPHPAV